MLKFNHYMSYTELSQALFFVYQQQRLLSKSELGCLELSLQDPFLQKILELYPLPKQSQKLVTDSLEQQRAQAPAAAVQVDTNIHSAIYGGVRERAARYLHQNYPTTGHANVIDKVAAFLQQILKKRGPQNELEIEERERYTLRQTKYAAGRLSTLTPRQTLDEITADFNAYVEHLRKLHQESSTYAWGPLSSVFHRLESLAENAAERGEAELLLLRALDDSRTAYHDKPHSYVAGKDYTCPRGLEERLLDHHALLVPSQRAAAGACPRERALLTLTEPFILRNAEQGRPSCSQACYQLYLNAAGYRVEERWDHYFELSPEADKARLKRQYQGTIGENSWEKIRAGDNFNAFMRLLEGTPCHELERDYEHLVAFFSQQEGLLGRVEKMRPHFTAPEALPRHETIIARMLAQGPFIDRAHLEMVLTLQDEKASLASMEQAAFSGTPGTGARFQQSAQEMRQAYQEYLATQEAPFYHFMDEQGLRARFGRSGFRTIGCSQTVLCQWLRGIQSQPSAATAQKLAVLCAKGGYASAITLLCEREDISADYVDRQERQSLLWMAVDHGHIEAVKALLAAGADVNLRNHSGWTALIYAAGNRRTDIVRALIAAGADVDLQDRAEWAALMSPAKSDYADIVSALIEAGADVNLRDHSRRTALMYAAENGRTDIVRVLLAAGADVNLRNHSGRTALMYATENGRTDIVKALLEALNPEHIFTRAMESRNIEMIRTSIAAGANVNRLSDRRSALDVAIQSGSSAMVRAVLASRRFAPWVIIKALKRCVENNEHHAEMLPLLLVHIDTVQMIIRNGHQKAPLAWAAEYQCVAAVQTFIAAGAPLDEQNDNNETAFMIAQRLGNEDLMALLRPRQSSEENDTLPAITSLIVSSERQIPTELQRGRNKRSPLG